MKIHNKFDFELKNADGEIVKRATAENTVLDRLAQSLVSNQSYFNYIRFGSGTEEPAASDVKLTDDKGGKSAALSGLSADWDNMIFTARKSITLAADEYSGVSISEVGISNSSYDTGLVTKSLLVDENGNVTALTKSDTEVLTIHATVYADFSAAEQNGVYISRSCFSSGLNNNFLPDVIGWALGLNSLTEYFRIKRFHVSYSTSNIKGTFTSHGNTITAVLPDVGVTDYNNLSIKNIQLGSSIGMSLPSASFVQKQINDEIVGTGNGVNIKFNTKFNFIKQSPAPVVKVNNQAATASIVYGLPQTGEQCFELYDYPRTYSTDEQNLQVPLELFTEGSWQASAHGWSIYKNKYYNAGVKITKVSFNSIDVYVSDDLNAWTKISSESIPEGLQTSKYWKIVFSNGSSYIGFNSIVIEKPDEITLDEAPAEGSVITVSYTPDCIAKDSEHILRGVKLSLTVNGE